MIRREKRKDGYKGGPKRWLQGRGVEVIRREERRGG